MKPYATRHHGHNIPHIHHEVLCDYTHRLNKEYDNLPLPWIKYFIVRINNLIKHSMRWKNTYNIEYDKNSQTITITGFPTWSLKRNFKIGIMQTEYTLHKMDYKQALIYVYGKNYVKLEFLTTKPSDEPCVKVVYLQEENTGGTINNTDCNVLTTDFNCYKCTCMNCRQECFKEEVNNGNTGDNGVSNGTTDNSGGNGTNDGNSDGEGNSEPSNDGGDTDTLPIGEGQLYP